MQRRSATPAAALLVAILAVGCGAPGGASGGGPSVMATTSILGDIAREVAGPGVEVQVLIPLGVDPHEFSPSPQQVALIQEADLVIANGLDLEEGLTEALAGADEVLEVAAEVDPVPLEEHEEASGDGDHANEHEGDGHEGLDPHVWMDPVRMAEAATLIGSRLADVSPGRWQQRADRYAERLRDLDEEIRGLLEPIPPERRKLVTNHEALGYFADRYDMVVLGTVIPGSSTLGEPSAAEFSELAELIRDHDVRAIFAETTQPSALAEALAGEVGHPVEIVELFTESLGPEGSGAGSYVEMMLTNSRRISEALG